ncbi:Phosphate transport ATP-binding protein PstB (TC 3.A.1.7.1) [hydrothermal vent metagenome]|uniref:Phosphate transport ATP-binding protein PstB (TC 3.A.1.7.1) n=1 Tax=hydrothermal vent metagenome TaxID=652676 RepID=A0A3B0UC23_9ZZZZ
MVLLFILEINGKKKYNNMTTKNVQEIIEIKKPKVISEKQNFKLQAKNVHVFYDDFEAIKNIDMNITSQSVTAFIGPSGCGKSTFLRLFNRMNDYVDSFTMEGKIKIDGANIYKKKIHVEELRKNVGMVFQKPNPFPKSIFENVAYGLKIQGEKNKQFIEERVKKALIQADLWNEVKDKLDKSALALSGGQQQRLCIARTLAVEPSVLLMDEPTSALDPISTSKIEELIHQLKEEYTIIIVTHNMQQAARISDYTAFFYMGELVEFDNTKKIFTNPSKKQTENYITGRFG